MPDKRYELFGWDYEAINPLAKQEVRWHLHWAPKASGPVLGLACGDWAAAGASGEGWA